MSAERVMDADDAKGFVRVPAGEGRERVMDLRGTNQERPPEIRESKGSEELAALEGELANLNGYPGLDYRLTLHMAEAQTMGG